MKTTYKSLGSIGRFLVFEIAYKEGIEATRNIGSWEEWCSIDEVEWNERPYSLGDSDDERQLNILLFESFLEGTRQGFYEMLQILSVKHLRRLK